MRLDFYKKAPKLKGMKARSTVAKGLNLSTRVEKPRRGKGGYTRKNRYNKWD